VHVDDVELVVHVDPPAEHKAYLHRSGRTARAGATGDVVTIALPTQKDDLRVVLRKAAIAATPLPVTATSPEVARLVGEVAPYVKPAPKAAQQRPQRSGGSRTVAEALDASRGGRRRGRGAGGADARTQQASGRGGQSARGGQAGAGRGAQPARGQQASGQSPRGGQQAGQSSRRGAAPSRGGYRVGDVVRPNGGTGRGRGPRRAQG
jgi:superfamily II DNA/RNA helicase